MNWFSWNFMLQEPTGVGVGEVRLSSWRERGSIVLAHGRYRIHRTGLGPFTLESPDGAIVASAVKPSAFRREFVVSDDHVRYRLKAVSFFRREYAVFRDERRIASIVPESWFRRSARVQFTEDLPVLLQAFFVWLALLMWKRSGDAG
jgi:hypothetical protein